MLVLAGIGSVQTGAAVAKHLFAVAGPAGMVTLRLVFSAAVLLLLSRPWRPRHRAALPRPVLVVAFGLVLGGMNLAFYQALARIPLGVAVTIEFLGPLAVALLASRRWRDARWALLAAVGVLLIADPRGGQLDPVGILFAAVAAGCWAGYILLATAVSRGSTGGSGLALASVVAAAAVTPIGLAETGTALLAPTVLAIGLVVALASSAIPYSLELAALRRMPPRVFGVLMSLQPATAAVIGLVLLREVLAVGQWLGIGAVIVASAAATLARETTARPGDRPG